MKKKITGLLVALMVLSMGTTVFASQSPTSEVTAEQKAQQLRDSVSNVETSQDGVNVEVGKVDATEVADANEKATSYSADAEVLGMVELKSDKDFSKGVTLTLYVAGVKKGDNVRILHKLSDGTWEVIVPYVGDGFVRATFYSLSPIAIVKYPANVSVSSSQRVPENAADSSTENNSTQEDVSNTSENTNTNESSNANNSTSANNNANIRHPGRLGNHKGISQLSGCFSGRPLCGGEEKSESSLPRLRKSTPSGCSRLSG